MEADGTLQTVALEIEHGQVAAIYVTRNPEKLAHISRLLPAEGAGHRHPQSRPKVDC